MIEVSVVVTIDEYLKTFASHSDANPKLLAPLEGKCSTPFFVFFIESVTDNNDDK